LRQDEWLISAILREINQLRRVGRSRPTAHRREPDRPVRKAL